MSDIDNCCARLCPAALRVQVKFQGMCFDVEQGGDAVLLQDCSASDNQLFGFVRLPDGDYNIRAKHSSKCVQFSDPGNVNVLHERTCDMSAGQTFKVFQM